jgi:hypothetical protein
MAGTVPRSGPLLTLWIVLTIGLQGVLWLSEYRTPALAEAVESGAERVETSNSGEAGDDRVRKAVRMQRDTLPFWTTLALLGDLVVEPLALVVRAMGAATLLSGAAGLAGRPFGFARAMPACVAAQGYWVMGLAARVLLTIILRTPEVDTSLGLALPPGTYPALIWLIPRQLDVFALLGWVAIAGGAWRRGQTRLVSALLICGLLGLGEATLRIGTTLVVEAGMRAEVGDLIVLPGWEED